MRHALQGLLELIRSERNARLHLLSTVLVLALGYQIGFDAMEWLWIGLAIAGVWFAELINSALETLVDLAQPEVHPLAKKAKDYAAAAVLVMAIWAVSVFALLAIPKLWLYLMLN